MLNLIWSLSPILILSVFSLIHAACLAALLNNPWTKEEPNHGPLYPILFQQQRHRWRCIVSSLAIPHHKRVRQYQLIVIKQQYLFLFPVPPYYNILPLLLNIRKSCACCAGREIKSERCALSIYYCNCTRWSTFHRINLYYIHNKVKRRTATCPASKKKMQPISDFRICISISKRNKNRSY